mgnify:FL=1
MGVLCLLAGIAAFFLPETLNRNLPQTLEEVESAEENNKTCWCREKHNNEEEMKDEIAVDNAGFTPET